MKNRRVGFSLPAVDSVLILLLFSCLSLSCRSTGGNVHLRSIPPEVEVVDLEDNTLLGITPCDSSWGGTGKKPKLITVRFQKPGYRDRIMTFTDTGKQMTVEIEMKEDMDED